MTIRSELLAIKGSKEFLIVEEAEEWARKNPKSKLHRSLEWDDRKAGREYRLMQIRRMVQIYLIYPTKVRNFVSLSVDRSRPQGGYRSVDDVLADQSLHSVMLEDALRELERMKARYDQLTQLKPVWAATAKVRRKFKARQGRKKGGGAAGLRASA